MTPQSLPQNPLDFMEWPWDEIKPHYDALTARRLTSDNVEAWLSEWSHLTDLVNETQTRLHVATTVDTADLRAKERYQNFLDTVFPASQAAEQRLKANLIASGLRIRGFEIPLRNMRAEAELFRQENLPLLSEEQKIGNEYNEIIGAQTVMWEGKEVTLTQLLPVFQNPDRTVRESAWRLASERQLADGESINAQWRKELDLRQRLAANSGYENYRDYRWRQLLRFDYGPSDCRRFEDAIEEVVVPAATRVYERGRRRLGIDRLRPWDTVGLLGRVVDPPDLRPLHPFENLSQLEATSANLFHRVDSRFGEEFQVMIERGLLDLANRKNKAPGAYSVTFEATGLPFIFANSVGLHADVQTVLHEAGHSFHSFETRHLPYFQQRAESAIPIEFAEVASMGMELLGSPYLAADEGGFYSAPDAARALAEHLEESLLFWPYMAVVDLFQDWVYSNIEKAREPSNCDAEWLSLWNRFIPGIDWSGLEQVAMTRWQRQLHIHQFPFYYVEYGLAQLGAVQVWRNSLSHQSGAVAAYRSALRMGATAPLPELFATAGVRFALDANTLREAVELMEATITRLDSER